jgi:hypothetical protein
VQALKNRAGWKEVEGDDWDFFYADTTWIHENMPYSGSGGLRLKDHQIVNHFPNHVEVRSGELLRLCAWEGASVRRPARYTA